VLDHNRRLWDELTPIHVRSAYYDAEGFRSGRSSLRPVEIEELGDVAGKRLLHLQCHFGLDTLSWARRGAAVTGVDFSRESISVARRLAAELGLDARFVCSDVCELRRVLDERFEVVFTSYGVLVWLPDLGPWAEAIAERLEPGGIFYVVEEHPLAATLAEEDGRVVVADSYFDVGAIESDEEGSYADRDAAVASGRSYEWQHPLSDVVCALVGAGLRIEFLHEHPFASWPRLPSMERGEDRYWRLPGRADIPLLFSLLARKP
jgi:SAM-dependent methyltransferase